MTDTALPFTSLLWPTGRPEGLTSDDVLHDLALDQIIEKFTPEAAAAPWRIPLPTTSAVHDRQDVFRALERPAVRASVDGYIAAWTQTLSAVDSARRARHPVEARLWHLAAIRGYSAAVDAFANSLPAALAGAQKASRLLTDLAVHVERLHLDQSFRRRSDRADAAQSAIDALRYNALLQGGKVSVAAYDDEPDLESAVLGTFDRFRQGDATDYRVQFRDQADLDHIQGWVLDQVVLLFPEPFSELAAFTDETRDFADPALVTFADEVRFFLTYLELLQPIRSRGLTVSYPTASESSRELRARSTWDLVLAHGLAQSDRTAVTNDLTLEGAERILVVSGPNQGGKTTTARTFGQLLHLAAIGCPVPGDDVHAPLADRVLTLFEREEQLDSLEGRLGTEIERIHDLLDNATPQSAIVLNEVFSSTTVQDARVLTQEVLERISALDAIAICVTFIDELSHLNEKTVSMTSTVDADDPAVRTFKVERRAADGRAYVRALAAKHGLTGEQIAHRLEDAR